MDVTHPYDTDESRLGLLYRLPVTGSPSRLLIVGDDVAALSRHWAGAEVWHAASLADLPAEQRFDVVAIPDLLAPNRVDASSLLCRAADMLAPGGMLVGHMAHGLALRHWAGLRGLWQLAVSLCDRRRPNCHGRVQAMLQAAGLREVECFYVVPSIQAPMALVPCTPVAARAQFARTLRSSRDTLSWQAYHMRRLLLALRAGPLLRDTLFFWAQRPC